MSEKESCKFLFKKRGKGARARKRKTSSNEGDYYDSIFQTIYIICIENIVIREQLMSDNGAVIAKSVRF